MRGTFQFAGLLAVVLIAGCGDDDSASKKAVDGGMDAGSKQNGGGAKGSGSGGSKSGTGSAGHTGSGGKGTPSNADEDGGGGGGTSGAAHDGGTNTDGSTSAGGSKDGGTPDGGGGTTQPAPGCAGLMDCCATLPSAQQMSCDLVTMNADDATCDQFQAVLCTPAGADAGTDSCPTLNQCCEFSAARTGARRLRDDGDERRRARLPASDGRVLSSRRRSERVHDAERMLRRPAAADARELQFDRDAGPALGMRGRDYGAVSVTGATSIEAIDA